MKTYILENEQIRAVIREKSAELISLQKKETGEEYLWNSDPAYWGWTSPVLFPVVGSFRDGKYSYHNKTYSMVQHGFARHRIFHTDSVTEQEIWMSIEDDEESFAIYPFHFRLEIGYRLINNSIQVLWKVHNKDENPMYFSIGGHPAILCPVNKKDGDRTSCYLGFEGSEDVLEYLMVDQETQRIGEKLHSFQLDDGIHRITKGMFDYDALIFEDYQIQTAFLAGSDGKPYIKMHTKSPLIAFWSPKEDAPFICFEPWYGRADGVNFNGTLEERAWGQSVEGHGTFEADYSLEIM